MSEYGLPCIDTVHTPSDPEIHYPLLKNISHGCNDYGVDSNYSEVVDK